MDNLQLIYAGTRLVASTNGVLVFKANKNWLVITGVRLSVFSPNTFSDTQFNLKKNGENLFTDELTIPVGEKEIDLTGLDLDVTETDEFRLDLTSTLGRVYAPIILELTVETSGGGAGASELNELSDVVISSPAEGDFLMFNGENWVNVTFPPGGGSNSQEFGLACSDEVTPLEAGTNKITFRMPNDFTLSEVRANLNAASSSGAVQVDINKNGSSVLSTKLTIDQGEKTSVSAATPFVISDDDFADDDEITIDIDGAGTDATGLKVWLIGTRE